MKKVIAIFAIAASTLLVACGGKGTTEATSDSTAVAVDSVATDSVATAPVADSSNVVK
jgi:major membrane immunogen (membrane-anchored lipoprotein)